ncbi:hypothetical protein HYALB_00010888 [Hymenoscyphus albidus]|uniref:Indoleamine 2,3-dioxygenase n=1 Tax=Hymenoscyphus albidus TaxID=595503 RepID=A0A9N9PWU8_9HELO|nr:hypothetical protein HYALB_00010888 [Hymenoscyphus albidus]
MSDVVIARIRILLFFTFSAAFITFSIKRYFQITVKATIQPNAKNTSTKAHTQELHPTEISLRNLIELDGAGSWPPKTSYGKAWPGVLRPYHDIYLELVPSLSTAELSIDDCVNYQRCLDYRAKYRHALEERINIEKVDALLSAAEKEDTKTLLREAWNGLFACIALSRHAYRWGTIPIVKLAQEEQVVNMPAQLDVPWEYLKRRFGVTSPGGNITSNYLCNFNNKAQLVYQINPSIYNFAHLLPAMEEQALQIYHVITESIQQHTIGDRKAPLQTLRQIKLALRRLLKLYYETMLESKISRKVWMRYVQGFQGWAAGTIDPIIGEYTEYDELSGNQLLLPQVIDAFLGLDGYLTTENTVRFIPKRQREFRDLIREHSFRQVAKDAGDFEVEEEMCNVVKQTRVFRTAHRVRVEPYLSVPAPERLIMTAGKSVLENDQVHDYEAAIALLDMTLADRLAETR